MKLILYSFINLIIFLNFTYASSWLNKEDALVTMQEMLDYHVEYKELVPLLIKRCSKTFIDQFDAEKTYLLSQEIEPYLSLNEKEALRVVEEIKQGNLNFFLRLMDLMHSSILRARTLRNELFREYIVTPKLSPQQSGETFLSYSDGENELENRLRKRILRFLFAEAKLSNLDTLTPEIKEKIFKLMDKKLERLEKTYLFLDTQGKKKSALEKFSNLYQSFLKAFAKSLDAHTYFFTKEEAEDLRANLEKQFEGVGVFLREGVRGVEIVDLVEGSPADRSSIQKGDLIVEIDGKRVENMGFDEVNKCLKGEVGSNVTLKIQTQQGRLQDVVLQREKIVFSESRLQTSYIPYANGIIGIACLSSFYESHDGESCERDLRKALAALRSQGDLKGLVLDLRTNSGGFLTQAAKVAGLFIRAGIVVVSKYSKGKVHYIRDLDGRMHYEGPMLVLTSKASASAAEIVAQVLQDYGTALIVGDERTYGKGTIQYQNVTDRDTKSFFKVTVGKYYTVSGRSTQIEGVKADISVPTVFYNLNIGERYLEYALAPDKIASVYIDPLSDVDEHRKEWFQKNYLPYLQLQDFRLKSLVPTLSINSAYRIQHNKDYQAFLKTHRQKLTLPSDEEDFALEEAVNILKDIVYLQYQN